MNVSYMQRGQLRLVHTFTLYCGHHGTTAVCPSYRDVHISEASGVFPVGVAIYIHAVECYKCTF